MECTSGQSFDASAATSCSCTPSAAAASPHDRQLAGGPSEGRLLPPAGSQSESELVILGILVALVLVLALTSHALCLHIQALKRQRRRRLGRFDLRPEDDKDCLGGQVVPRERRLEEEEEEVCRYSEASCSTPSSGFQSDSLDSRGGGGPTDVAEHSVHLLQPVTPTLTAGRHSKKTGYDATMTMTSSSPLIGNCRRQPSGAACAGEPVCRNMASSPDSHLDEALRLLQMTTNHLQREP